MEQIKRKREREQIWNRKIKILTNMNSCKKANEINRKERN